MSHRGDEEILYDIREACERISEYTEGMEYDEFEANTMVQDSVIRNIEVIGEGVKNLSNEIKDKYPEIPWKDIAGMRDKLIHFYFGVDT